MAKKKFQNSNRKFQNKGIKNPQKNHRKLYSDNQDEIKSFTVLLDDLSLVDFQDDYKNSINVLKDALKSTGYQFKYIDNHKNFIKEMINKPPKFVFNFSFNGFMNRDNQYCHPLALLEMLDIPYSGANLSFLNLSSDKHLTHLIAKENDIPVPWEMYIDLKMINKKNLILPDFPFILKPCNSGGSYGILEKSVFYPPVDLGHFWKTLDEIRSHPYFAKYEYTDWILQELLPGTEYSVTVLGNGENLKCLPISETSFCDLPLGFPPIKTFEYKYVEGTFYSTKIFPQKAKIPKNTQTFLENSSKKLFRILKGQDYARIDFKCANDGTIKLLEVNSNPCITHDSAVGAMASYMGKTYNYLIQDLVNIALERIK